MMNQVIEFMIKMKRKMQRRRFVMIHSLCKSKQQSRRQASPVETIGRASADSASVAMVYRSELDYISRCILDSKTIETGGQLFGFWTSTGIPVVLYAIGPGPHANHQCTFFNQDVDYLVKVGKMLLQRYGLQHIGEWHSHHQLGLAHPSGHDASNMQMVIDQKHLGRFLLCIGNCDAHASTLNAFSFLEGHQDYQHASWLIKEMDSPYRQLVDRELHDILLHPCCQEPNMVGLKVLGEEKPVFSQEYWLRDKPNNLVLKKMIDFLNLYADNRGCDVKLDGRGHVHLFLDKQDGSIEEIYFPGGFPQEAPVVKLQDRVMKAQWNYNGDIYGSFTYYYGMSLPQEIVSNL